VKGDYSRSTFSPRKRYSSVRMQQGRVQLDADWNEQADILRHAIVSQARDLIGASAAPDDGAGFALGVAMRQRTPDGPELPDLSIGAGWYYVDGLRCDNDQELWYSDLPGAIGDALGASGDGCILVYLDVWERHITAIEDPELREVALGGPDTTARTATVWQVRLLPMPVDLAAPSGGEPGWAGAWRTFVDERARKARMAVTYQGYGGALGNHLYRIEIHHADGDGASFKWSRENGAVAFPIIACAGQDASSEPPREPGSDVRLSVCCALLDRDQLALVAGDLVELEDDLTAFGATASLLARVVEVRLEPGAGDQIGMVSGCVILSADPAGIKALRERWSAAPSPAGTTAPDERTEAAHLAALHPLLRRWDRSAASPPATESPPGWQPPMIVPGQPYELEHGLTVCFDGADSYTAGDYWQIVARTDLACLDLPPRPPDGTPHHYAPIGLLARRDGAWRAEDLRRRYRDVPRLGDELDAERRRLDGTVDDLARLRANFDALLDEIGYLRRKVKDVRGRLHYDYQADDQLDLGQVVAADPAREGYIVKTLVANERLVIGVVGEILSEHGTTIYRVVVYGRVPCKVVGTVAPGDLLTVAAEEGYARRGGIYLRPGTVIGKALAASAPDEVGLTGMVDAMVTLA
jgi:hypothetical protein